MSFGAYIKGLREAKQATDSTFSLRQVAARIGVEPSYLSKLERDPTRAPSEDIIHALARELGANPNILWAMTGRVTKAFQEALLKRPELFAKLLAEEDASKEEVRAISQHVRDGNW